MALREILTIGDPLLRMPARRLRAEELSRGETQTLIDDLVETMQHPNGAGLAAPQVGWACKSQQCMCKTAHVTYKPNIPLTVFVNPVIRRRSEAKALINEGCLSVPGWRGEVTSIYADHDRGTGSVWQSDEV